MTTKVAAALQRKMKAEEWGYRELAKFLGVPLSQAYGWATGDASPNLVNAKRISKRLDVSIAELV